MIKIDVRKYCDRCPHFEPEVAERPEVEILTRWSVAELSEKQLAITHGDTIVKCRNRYRCEGIYEYMEGKEHAEN